MSVTRAAQTFGWPVITGKAAAQRPVRWEVLGPDVRAERCDLVVDGTCDGILVEYWHGKASPGTGPWRPARWVVVRVPARLPKTAAMIGLSPGTGHTGTGRVPTPVFFPPEFRGKSNVNTPDGAVIAADAEHAASLSRFASHVVDERLWVVARYDAITITTDIEPDVEELLRRVRLARDVAAVLRPVS
ncbi:MAG: hypothetical protein ACRDPS_14250 [Nocardioides sp.]|uniref:hypothetical protein n=1 Tax=Nocardioides sp. TaxID=35761 RepID=UPI003D6A299D